MCQTQCSSSSLCKGIKPLPRALGPALHRGYDILLSQFGHVGEEKCGLVEEVILVIWPHGANEGE